MAMGWCRECKVKVSSEAKVCPSCGAPNPYKASRVGAFGWIGAGAVGLLAFTMCSPKEDRAPGAATASNAPRATPAKTAAQLELENRQAMQTLKPAELRPILADKLLPYCKAANSSLNYIQVEVRGTALYCVHDFYNRYSLSIGPLAKAIEAFHGEWRAELLHAGVKRIGVYGKGEHASGAWFTID